MNKNDCEFQQKCTTSTDRVKQPFYSQSVGLKSCILTIQMTPQWEYFHIILFVFQEFTK